MSAAGRGLHLGGDEDVYPTPAWCVRRFFERFRPRTRDGLWVEPGVGDGAIVKTVDEILGPRNWRTVDMRSTAAAMVKGDFMSLDRVGIVGKSETKVSVVITNPPYNSALEFIEHAQKLFPEADIVMLLRVNFLAGENRVGFMHTYMPDVFILPNRPVFRLNEHGKRATDATEYCWMVWRGPAKRQMGYTTVLGSTSKEDRAFDEPKSIK
jgi:hypothetical protein